VLELHSVQRKGVYISSLVMAMHSCYNNNSIVIYIYIYIYIYSIVIYIMDPPD